MRRRRIFRSVYQWLKSETMQSVGKVGLFAIGVTIVSYWISYQDRDANRQNTAWNNLRAAISWTESPGHWGNAGQIGAIETLTQDCGRWWRNTFLRPVFELVYHDCVDLNSLALANMELGSLQAAGANLSHADISCANLAQANLRNANLMAAKFRGSNLAGIDLRGAVLSGGTPDDDADFWLADLSLALMDSSTKVNLAKLKCACIETALNQAGRTGPATGAAYVKSPEILATLRGLQPCPENKCDAGVSNAWKCSQ